MAKQGATSVVKSEPRNFLCPMSNECCVDPNCSVKHCCEEERERRAAKEVEARQHVFNKSTYENLRRIIAPLIDKIRR
jgi:hypothetical protein